MEAPIDPSIDLVQRAQRGDRDALEQLVVRYYGRVRRAVRARLGPRLRGRLDSNDILQQTFLHAVKRLDRFALQSEGGLVHWLSKIAEAQIRDAADYHAAQRRSVDRELSLNFTRRDDGESLVDALADRTPTPLQELSQGERQRLFEQCIDRLPSHYREVLVLRAYEQVAWHDIATLMGRPSESAVRSIYSQALGELERMLRRRGLDSADS